MKAMNTTGSWIDVEQVVLFVRHYFQNMGMAADEKIGWVDSHDFPDPFVVPARIPANMSDPHIHSFTIEPEVQWKCSSQFTMVYIAIHRPQWLECFQLLYNFHIPDIPCMPNLVHLFEILKDLGVQRTMGIGQQSYFFHAHKIRYLW